MVEVAPKLLYWRNPSSLRITVRDGPPHKVHWTEAAQKGVKGGGRGYANVPTAPEGEKEEEKVVGTIYLPVGRHPMLKALFGSYKLGQDDTLVLDTKEGIFVLGRLSHFTGDSLRRRYCIKWKSAFFTPLCVSVFCSAELG